MERVRRRVEQSLERAGLKLPFLVHYEHLNRTSMQHLAACSGIPYRYLYPWVVDRIEKDLTPPWEITAYSPMGALVYILEDALISDERIIAHATAHAHLFLNHRAWQHSVSAEVLGGQSRNRMQLLERTVGREALWAFLDECSEHTVDATVRLTEPWHFIAVNQVENERAYLKPFRNCLLLAEGFASYWEFAIAGKCLETGPYHLGRILVEQVYRKDHVELLYEMDDRALVRGYYTQGLARHYRTPWIAWTNDAQLDELVDLLQHY